MTYRDQLHPWCIVRSLPNNQMVVVARFGSLADAEAQLQLLREMSPNAAFSIILEEALPEADGSEPSDAPDAHDSSYD